MSDVLIKYIGNQPEKVDNVRPKSGRVWSKPGAVLPIPDTEKFSYLAHPGVWKLVTQEEHEAEQETTQQSIEEIEALIMRLELEPLYLVRKAADARIASLEANRPPMGTLPISSGATTSQQAAESMDEGTLAAYHERITAIAGAIKRMDLLDDRFATDGFPKAEAIQDDIGGPLPTEDEIIAALDLNSGRVPADKVAQVQTGIPEVLAPGLGTQPAAEEGSTEAADEGGQEKVEDAQQEEGPGQEGPTKDQLKEMAESALGEVDTADRETLARMNDVFGLGVNKLNGDDNYRAKVKSGLEAIKGG